MDNKNFSGKTAEFQEKKSKYTYSPQGMTEMVKDGVKEVVSDVQNKMYQKKVMKKLKNYGEEPMGLLIGFGIAGVCTGGFGASTIGMIFIALALGFGIKWKLQSAQSKRMLNYWNILSNSKEFPIGNLAQLTGESKSTIYKDLDKMINLGVFQEYFVDRHNDKLILQNVEAYISRYQTIESQNASFANLDGASEAQAFLEELRSINEEIKNPKLTEQISQIEVLTGKIFSAKKDKQDSNSDLSRFMSYYLPTTLKLLSTYAEMEHQNIQGDNITKSMKEIENMMSKVVESFEKQLDQMYKTDTMDIASDISVLEQMFEKDGLTGNAMKLDYTPKNQNSSAFDIDLKF